MPAYRVGMVGKRAQATAGMVRAVRDKDGKQRWLELVIYVRWASDRLLGEAIGPGVRSWAFVRQAITSLSKAGAHQ